MSSTATGKISNVGTTTSSLVLTGSATGTLTNRGKTSSTLSLVGSARGILQGTTTSRLVLTGHATGYSTVTGTTRSTLSLVGFAQGITIVPNEDVWVVNLATGGHARYMGDMTGATPVAAFALTGVCQLGSDRAKFVHEAFVNMRTDGDAEITTITDEQQTVGPYLIESDGREGAHRRRSRMAKGVKGTVWQFRIANVDGSIFTLKSLEVPPVVSQRVQ